MYWASDTQTEILVQKQIQMFITKLHSCFPTTSCRTIQIHYPWFLLHTLTPQSAFDQRARCFQNSWQVNRLTVSSCVETIFNTSFLVTLSCHAVFLLIESPSNGLGWPSVQMTSDLLEWRAWWSHLGHSRWTKGHLCHHFLTHCPISQAVPDFGKKPSPPPLRKKSAK